MASCGQGLRGVRAAGASRAFVGLLVGGFLLASPARAVTFIVDSTEDATDAQPGDGVCATLGGACTLRAAVQEGNATEGGASIQIPPGTYLLTIPGTGEDAAASGDLNVAATALTGSGPDETIIDAGGLDNVIDVLPIPGASEVSISDLTVRGGDIGIVHFRSGPTLHLRNVRVTGNTSAGVASGPAGLVISDSKISDNAGPGVTNFTMSGLTLVRSTVRGNTGGGVIGGQGTRIEDCLIENNRTPGDGGGVGSPQSIMIARSRIVGNSAAGSGGGVYVSPSFSPLARGTSFFSLVEIVDSVVSDNQAALDGGGVASRYGLTMSGTIVDRNAAGRDGGGLHVGAGAGVGLQVTGSSVINNVADRDGGGVWTERSGPGWAINLTISGNRAAGDGGGVYARGEYLDLVNVTIAANTADADRDGVGDGGGVFADAPGLLSAGNSIIATNVDAGGESPDCAGTLVSTGYNLVQSVQGCILDGTTAGNLTGVDPHLAALEDNGGGSPTHRLEAASPAIDGGDPAGCADPDGSPIETDQRGVGRPKGERCDMGAYEFACGDGLLDLSEECDDGNVLVGDCCSDRCRFDPRGGACADDGQPCTVDACDGAGACVHAFPGAGACTPARSAGGSLVLGDHADPARRRLVWTWRGSGPTTPADFGTPTASTDLTLCLGDEAGAVLLSASVPAGGVCRKSPCWRATKLGFAYRDRDMSPQGILGLALRTTRAGTGMVSARAKGPNLSLPSLPLRLPVTARLVRHDAPECWEATFSAARRNELWLFKATSD